MLSSRLLAASLALAMGQLMVGQQNIQYIQQGSKLVGTGAPGSSEQGYSVALSADGNTALVGGYLTSLSAWSVWVYTRSAGVWTQTAQLTGTGAVAGTCDFTCQFAVSLSGDGNTALVGLASDNGNAGAAWVFTQSNGVWGQQGSKLVGTGAVYDAEQGLSVALSGDGNTAILGGPGDNAPVGAVWVFIRSGGVWTQQGGKLVGTGAVGGSGQGSSVALSGDGNTAAVGGESDSGGTGATWVFTQSGGDWTQQGSKLVGTGAVGAVVFQGQSAALSGDGNTLLVGGSGDNSQVGAAWVFARFGGVWTQQGSKLVGTGESSQQGWSVGLSSDGSTAVVGGSYAGTVFTRSGTTWSQLGTQLVGSGAVGYAGGFGVAVSGDASTILVGGPDDNSYVGAAWPFVISGPAPSITGLSPGAATAGGPAFTLTVSGANFLSGAVVEWNGTALTTRFVSSAQLTGAVPASLIVSAGTASLTVTNPDGNSSAPSNLTITGPVTITGPTSLPAGTFGVAYRATTITASGGVPPYAFSAPALPAGLAIGSATGVIAGTPTVTFAGSVTVTVTDSNLATVAQTYSLTITNPVPSLSIVKTHTGTFAYEQVGTYAVTVSNASGAGPTSGTVTLTETMPSGLSLISMAGDGWTCASGGNTCTRTDGLAGGASYPSIAVTVNVAATATSPQVNSVSVSGGSSAGASASDSTVISSSPAIGSITEYAVPTAESGLTTGIATGPDGALWFTEGNGNKIGRITTAGVIAEYPVPTPGSYPFGITAGPDGALWFTEENGNKIGRITTAGVVTNEYAIPTANSQYAGSITSGPDGALWFTELSGNKIARITTAGVMTEYALPMPVSGPYGITAGPDGALWFTEVGNPATVQAGKIGRITTDGVITEYALSDGPCLITAGPDGALWYTECAGDNIGRITTSGVITEYPTPSSRGVSGVGITSGPDGALWFAVYIENMVGRVTVAGVVTEYAVPTPNSQPNGIAAGPDGAIWFTEQSGNKIGRIVPGSTIAPALSIAKTHSGNFTQGQQGATYTITVSNSGTASTSGAVTVTETAPSGLTVVSMAGGGWACSVNACTRSDQLAAGVSYPSITVTVNVSASASSPQVNMATVSGGGSASASAGDSTMVTGTSCTYSLNPPPPAPAVPNAAGTGTVTVTTQAGCAWTASSNASWLTITAGSSGTGGGTVNFSVAAYTGTTQRSGTLTIAGIAFPVTQLPPPVLTISSSHSGNFVQGGTGSYQITVSDSAGTSAATGTVTVTENLPAGLALGSMAGSGWICAANSCNRSDTLPPGSSYANITVTVNVAPNAPGQVTNQVSVAGGGSVAASANDPTVIQSATCAFTLGSTSASLTQIGTASPGGVQPEVPVAVSASAAAGATCTGSYAAVSSASWLSAVGSANGFTYTALTNPHPEPRSATLTVTNPSGGTASFTVSEAGDPEVLLDRQVRALYQSVLGRDPDAGGFAFWTGSGAAGLGQMADSFLTSPEAFNSDFAVMAAYQAATGAVPGYANFTNAVASIRSGTSSIGQLFSLLIAGNSGYSSATLYQNLLNRAPTASDGTCIGMGLAACFETIIGFPSNVTPADAVNNEFQSTGTFRTADHTNGLYITMLYYTILNRDPDPSGLQFWLGIANSGGPGVQFQGGAGGTGYPTRIQILGPGTAGQGFIGSPEFQELYQ